MTFSHAASPSHARNPISSGFPRIFCTGRDSTPTLGKFPFWHPEPERRGFFQISSQTAFDAGWAQRPFTEAALEDLWFFDQLDSTVWSWADELSFEAEARALKAWRDARPNSRTGS
jgi:hypothetical protein